MPSTRSSIGVVHTELPVRRPSSDSKIRSPRKCSICPNAVGNNSWARLSPNYKPVTAPGSETGVFQVERPGILSYGLDDDSVRDEGVPKSLFSRAKEHAWTSSISLLLQWFISFDGWLLMKSRDVLRTILGISGFQCIVFIALTLATLLVSAKFLSLFNDNSAVTEYVSQLGWNTEKDQVYELENQKHLEQIVPLHFARYYSKLAHLERNANKMVNMFRQLYLNFQDLEMKCYKSTEYTSQLERFVKDYEEKHNMLNSDVQQLQSYLQIFKDYINNNNGGEIALEEENVKKLLHDRLAAFHADKVGMPDFALESVGGSVIGTPNTDSYPSETILKLFGIIPLSVGRTNPRQAIEAGVHPGQCWAFKGSKGQLRLQLAGFVLISGFTIEHIPRSLSLSGKLDSAPKDFSVHGLSSEDDTEGVLLGTFRFNIEGLPWQYFEVENNKNMAFNIVELKILSNHGHKEYTCVYRFRVHGKFFDEEATGGLH